jgi:hypothetical protein
MDSREKYPELEAIIQKLIRNDEGQYRNIDEVIEDYQHFIEKIFGDEWYEQFSMEHFLECRPGYERSLVYSNVYCLVHSEGLKDCYQNFCVYENTVTKLIYGRNIIGARCTKEKVVQTEIGAFYYIGDGVRFMPLHPECKYLKEDGMDIIQYMDVTIRIDVDPDESRKR